MSSRRGTCARCNRDRSIKARRLCERCLNVVRMEGRTADYPTRFEANVKRNEHIVALYKSGKTLSEIVAELGVTYDTVRSVTRSSGVAASRWIDPPWLRKIEPAPTRPPCVGQTMDTDGLQLRELHPDRNADIEQALDLCATCPLATRQWCLRTVDPRGIGKEWQGVAGGAVWSHGRLVYMPADLEAAS